MRWPGNWTDYPFQSTDLEIFHLGTHEHSVPNVVVHYFAGKLWLVEGDVVLTNFELKDQGKYLQ
jgi:hypothetical protein